MTGHKGQSLGGLGIFPASNRYEPNEVSEFSTKVLEGMKKIQSLSIWRVIHFNNRVSDFLVFHQWRRGGSDPFNAALLFL